jgi:hypothetical protein
MHLCTYENLIVQSNNLKINVYYTSDPDLPEFASSYPTVLHGQILIFRSRPSFPFAPEKAEHVQNDIIMEW